MPDYICERCGWSTKIKSQLRNHFFRIKPCNPIISDISIKLLIEDFFPESLEKYEVKLNNKLKKLPNLNCKFCNNLFSSKQSKWFHEKNCKFILKDNENSLIQQLKEKDEIIKQQKELLEIAKETCKKSNIINSNNTTNNTTINLQINAFGNENLSYISKSFLDSLIKIPYASIPKLLEEIHFNKKCPENQNIKITNRKEKWALKFNGTEWEFVPKNTVINDMISNGVNILETHYEENGGKEELTEVKQERWEQFTEDFHDEKPTTIKRLFDDTECLLINKSISNNQSESNSLSNYPNFSNGKEFITDLNEDFDLIIEDPLINEI